MIKHYGRIRVCAVAVAACLLAAAAMFAGTVVSARAAETEAFEYHTIGSQQGKGNFYYAYGNPIGAYYLAEWDTQASVWATSETYAAIGLDGNMHPGNSCDVMLIWRAPQSGKASLIATVKGVNGEDGVKFSMYRRVRKDVGFDDAALMSEKYPATVSPGSSEQSFEEKDVTVRRGDLIFFVVNRNGNNAGDSNVTRCAVRFAADDDAEQPDGEIDEWADLGVRRKIDPKAWYSDKQGTGGWFTAYGRPDAFVPMTYGTCEDGIAWHGVERYSNILADGMHPGGLFGVMRVWVAEVSGTVAIEGTITKNGAGGDGVNAGIYHSGNALWEKKFAAGDTQPVEADFTFEVSRGDKVVLYLDSGDNYNNTGDSFSYRTELYYLTRADETPLTADELSERLGALTHGEFVGVIHIDDQKTGEFDELGGGCNSALGSAHGSFAVVLMLTAGIALPLSKRRNMGRKAK